MRLKKFTEANEEKLTEASAGIMRYAAASAKLDPERLVQTTLGDLVSQVYGRSVATDLDIYWIVAGLVLIAGLEIELADGTVITPYTVHLPPPSPRYAADTLVAIHVADMTHLTPQDMQDANDAT